MSKENIRIGGNITDFTKNYQASILQVGVPILDVDWNNFQDIIISIQRETLKLVGGSESVFYSDGLKITKINNGRVSVDIGTWIYKGFLYKLHNSIEITKETYNLADGTETGVALDLSANKNFYLKLYFRYVDYTEDPNLVHPQLAVMRCARLQLCCDIYYATSIEGDTEMTADSGGYWDLALNKQIASVSGGVITDLRDSYDTSVGLLNAIMINQNSIATHIADVPAPANVVHGNKFVQTIQSYEQATDVFASTKAIYDYFMLFQQGMSMQTSVEAIQNAPPGSPSDNERYLVGTGTGLWSGHDDKIAEWSTEENPDAWVFTSPQSGFLVKVKSPTPMRYWHYTTLWEESNIFNSLIDLQDVNITPGAGEDNKVITYDHSSGKFILTSKDATSDFTDLSDTPVNYTGQKRKVPTVNNDENALVWGQGGAIAGDRVHVINSQVELDYYLGSDWQTDGGSGWYGASKTYYSQTVNGVVIPEYTTLIINPILGDINTSGQWLSGKGAHGDDTYNGREGYILRNKIYLSKGAKILGFNEDDVVVVKCNDGTDAEEDLIKFYTSYKEQGTSTSQATSVFTGAAGFGDKFNIGDWVHWSRDNSFYPVTATSSTTVTVNHNITDTGGSGTLSSMITDIKMEGWSYDGRGGCYGLGGDINCYNLNGGGFSVLYLCNSILNCKIINQQVQGSSSPTGHGGAIDGDEKSAHITAERIEHCAANFYGGGVYGVHYGKFIVKHTTGSSGGGGAYNCPHSDIHAEYCDAGNGGGAAASCSYSRIVAKYCRVSANTSGGGGAVNCHYSHIVVDHCYVYGTLGYGGGATTCHNSIIMCNNCFAGGGGGSETSAAGGVWKCDYSKIVLNDCYSEANYAAGTYGWGGGARECDHSEIVINGCHASNINGSNNANGGGAYLCTYCKLTIRDCTADGNGGGAHSCTNCDINVKDCSITGTTGIHYGGGCHSCTDSVISVDGCTITVTTGSGNGGGVSQSNYCSIKAINCSVEATGAGGNAYGGGVYDSDYCDIHARKCTVEVTTGYAYGGGVDTSRYCTLVLNSCSATASSTGYGRGGGVNDSGHCTVTCRDCSATSSTAANGQGGGANACVNMICVGNWVGNSSSAPGANANIRSNGAGYAGSFASGATIHDYTTGFSTADLN